MFWRIVFQLLRGSRARLTVAILALVSGAAVISGLLNLDFGVEYQLTQQFRTLGANVVIAPTVAPPAPESTLTNSALMDENAIMSQVQQIATANVSFAPFAYVIAQVGGTQVVAVGTWLDQLHNLNPTWKMDGQWISSRADARQCLVGRNAARHLHLRTGDSLELRYLARTSQCEISGTIDSGSMDDNQVFVSLDSLQALAGLPAKISVVQLSVNGTPNTIGAAVDRLRSALPQFQVHPIREVTEAEGALLSRIRLLIISMVILILVLTALCVLATMAALAMERRADVGLMKALGGSIARIVTFFVAEVGLLGAVGGLVGAVLGVGLSYWMGLRVFGTAVAPQWQIFPITIILMTLVAMAGAWPLRILGEVKPAIILRGE
jgi:putative ABC transport system permease protein